MYDMGMTQTYIIAGSAEFRTGNPLLVVKDLAGAVLGSAPYAALPLHAGSDVQRILAAVAGHLPKGRRRVENVGRVIHVAIDAD